MKEKSQGSVVGGAIWMIVISLLLCWLPGVGGFLGGLVGGKVSGSVGAALVAWIVSSILVAAVFGLLGTALTGMVVIGFAAGLGALVIGFLDAGMRLFGALIGGFMAS